MKVHCTGPRLAIEIEPQRRRRLGIGGPPGLEVDEAVRHHQPRRGGQRWSAKLRIERRVDEDHLEGRGGAARHPGQRVGVFDAKRGSRFQALARFIEAPYQCAVALQQHDFGGAARGGLEAERARAGECVQAAPAGQVLAEPVEERHADPVRRRPQTGSIVHRQAAALPDATDDADFARQRAPATCRRHWRTGMPSRANSALTWPTLNSP